jgi:hypothetical protein
MEEYRILWDRLTVAVEVYHWGGHENLSPQRNATTAATLRADARRPTVSARYRHRTRRQHSPARAWAAWMVSEDIWCNPDGTPAGNQVVTDNSAGHSFFVFLPSCWR